MHYFIWVYRIKSQWKKQFCKAEQTSSFIQISCSAEVSMAFQTKKDKEVKQKTEAKGIVKLFQPNQNFMMHFFFPSDVFSKRNKTKHIFA